MISIAFIAFSEDCCEDGGKNQDVREVQSCRVAAAIKRNEFAGGNSQRIIGLLASIVL